MIEAIPPIGHVLEVAAYSLLNFLPFVLLALYPFHDQLRFGLRATGALLVGVVAIQLGLGQLAAFGDGNKGVLTIVSTVIYTVFFFAAVRAPLGKSLFTLLMLSNVANLVTTDAKCLEGLLFGPTIAHQSYRWTFSACMLGIEVVIIGLLTWYFRNYYSDGINKKAGEAAWNLLWLIPATFYLIWFWWQYGNGKPAIEVALEPGSALFLLAVNLGAFLVYHTVVRLINELEENRRLTENNHQLAIQAVQYESLTNQIDVVRRTRHDVRHHVAVLERLLDAREYDKARAYLRDYLRDYQETLPDDAPLVFCRHIAVNALLRHFAQQARACGVRFTAKVDMPKEVGVSDEALVVLLGNLAENALEACQRVIAARGCEEAASGGVQAADGAGDVQAAGGVGGAPTADGSRFAGSGAADGCANTSQAATANPDEATTASGADASTGTALREDTACATTDEADAAPQIIVLARVERGAMLLQVENTCLADVTPTRDWQGRILSTKHKGAGIGLESARSIATRYDGLLEVEQQGSTFRVSTLLNVPES